MTKIGMIFLLLMAPVLAGCGSGGPSVAEKAAAAAVEANAPAVSNDYIIGPGDRLNVVVYDNPQVSMALPVRPDGRISLPLIPDIVAAGQTPTKLGEEIAKRLTDFIRDPHVSVIVMDFVGVSERRVRVIGEAAEPAAFPYTQGMTLLDLMIASKGLTKFAAGNSALLVRGVGPNQRIIKVRLFDLIKDGDISANVVIQPGDTLVIPQSWF